MKLTDKKPQVKFLLPTCRRRTARQLHSKAAQDGAAEATAATAETEKASSRAAAAKQSSKAEQQLQPAPNHVHVMQT